MTRSAAAGHSLAQGRVHGRVQGHVHGRVPRPSGWRRLGATLAAVWLSGLVTLAAAALPGQAARPWARVGMLSWTLGPALMQVDPEVGWQTAEINTPVAAGSHWAAEPGARLELRIGQSMVHVASGARMAVVDLNERNTALDLVRGLLVVRVRTLAPGETFSISVPGARLDVLAAGSYRIQHVAGERRLTVQAQQGQGRLVMGEQTLPLSPDQKLVVDAGRSTLIESGPAAARIPLEDFAQARDPQRDASPATRRLAPEMTGAELLDGHGRWQAEPGLGPVWVPDKLPPDWAPYRFGRWIWLPVWGWTWLDSAPWGFAPSHYGRWLFTGGHWAWWPGRAATGDGAPVYAPAVVAFYGRPDQAGWPAAGAAAPVVGWYPLAPGEAYWPAYSDNMDHARALNAPYVADPNLLRRPATGSDAGPAHRYARTAFAASALPLADFAAMRLVQARGITLAPAALAQAPLAGLRGPPAIEPERSGSKVGR